MIVVEEKLGQESLVRKGLRQCWDASLCDVSICQGDNPKRLDFSQAFGDLLETFIADWVIIQIRVENDVFGVRRFAMC